MNLRDEIPRARPYSPPVNDLQTLDMLRDEFSDWDIGETAGAYWGYQIEDGPQECLLWGMTVSSLADAIRADIAARGGS